MHRMLLVNRMSWCVEGAIEGVLKIDRVNDLPCSIVVRGQAGLKKGACLQTSISG